MIELGQLEKHWREFDSRKVQVVAVSIEDREDAEATQADFPHLVIVSDADRQLSRAATVIHEKSSPDRGDTAKPSTLLIDGDGVVRWTFRPNQVFDRLSPSALLAAIDEEMPAE